MTSMESTANEDHGDPVIVSFLDIAEDWNGLAKEIKDKIKDSELADFLKDNQAYVKKRMNSAKGLTNEMLLEVKEYLVKRKGKRSGGVFIKKPSSTPEGEALVKKCRSLQHRTDCQWSQLKSKVMAGVALQASEQTGDQAVEMEEAAAEALDDKATGSKEELSSQASAEPEVANTVNLDNGQCMEQEESPAAPSDDLVAVQEQLTADTPPTPAPADPIPTPAPALASASVPLPSASSSPAKKRKHSHPADTPAEQATAEDWQQEKAELLLQLQKEKENSKALTDMVAQRDLLLVNLFAENTALRQHVFVHLLKEQQQAAAGGAGGAGAVGVEKGSDA